jgi:uncharacterized RDD family membrane protein YckC
MSLGGSIPPDEPWRPPPVPPMPPRGRDLTPRHRGAELGLPMTGPGSIAGLGIRFLGAMLDALILTPFILWRYASEHARFVNQVSSTGVVRHRFVYDRLPTTEALFFLIPSAIYAIGLIGWRGQTLGEQILGLRVIRVSDRQVPGYGLAALRWIVAVAASVVLVFTQVFRLGLDVYPLLVFGWAIFDGNRQGLHDKAARVIVVRTR